MSEKVGIGVGVIVEHGDGRILVGKRIGSHAQGRWSVPGGSLKPGESLTDAAVREIREEANISIGGLAVIGFTNNLETWESDGIHNMSAVIVASEFSGSPIICEPTKCAEWRWCLPEEVPQPQFEAHATTMELYLGSNDNAMSLSPNVYRVQ